MCLTGSAAVQPAGEVTGTILTDCAFFFSSCRNVKKLHFQKTEQKKIN